MASQNLPGVAVIRASGYTLPISKIITLTGVATLLLAPFGTIGSGLSAALHEERHREAARITFLVTLSGVRSFLLNIFALSDLP